jgi:hypothetical protein
VIDPQAEMVEGYRDGFSDADSPEPSSNRSASYRHGFAVGRADRRRKAHDTAANLRRDAEAAIAADLTGSAEMAP